MPDRLRVLLVHASAQSALSAFLAEQDMVVDARAELPSIAPAGLDVIVVEERLLGPSAQTALARVRELSCETAVVVTGMRERSLANAVYAGSSAAGYWSIDSLLEELVDLVRTAADADLDRVVTPIRG